MRRAGAVLPLSASFRQLEHGGAHVRSQELVTHSRIVCRQPPPWTPLAEPPGMTAHAAQCSTRVNRSIGWARQRVVHTRMSRAHSSTIRAGARAASTTCGAGEKRDAQRARPCSPLQTPHWRLSGVLTGHERRKHLIGSAVAENKKCGTKVETQCSVSGRSNACYRVAGGL